MNFHTAILREMCKNHYMAKSKLPIKELFSNDLFLPILLIVIYFFFLVIARGVIPTSEELINDFANLYLRFGYLIIFFSALLESLVVVNLFLPGQAAMVLGVLFSITGQTELYKVLIAACLGANLGYTIDYSLGRLGFANIIKKLGYDNLLTEAKNKLRKFKKRGLVIGFFHTNVGSFISVASGIIKTPYPIFITISLMSTIFWSIIWSLLIISFGDVFLLFIKKYSFLLVLMVISGMVLTRVWGQRK